MFLFQRILTAIRNLRRREPTKNFNLDTEVVYSLERVAQQQDRTPEELANHLLSYALSDLEIQRETWLRWNTLSPQQKQVATLICLGKSSTEIAKKMNISSQTVKTYVERILMKMNVADRKALRARMNGWDFKEGDY